MAALSSSLLITILVLLSSCSSVTKDMSMNRFEDPETQEVAMNRFDSPEAFGYLRGLAQVHTTGTTEIQPVDNVQDRSAANLTRVSLRPNMRVGMGAGVGFAEKLDFSVRTGFGLPNIFSLKYQVLGEGRQQSKAGNFSLSTMVGIGGQHITKRVTDPNTQLTGTVKNRTNVYEVSLIGGYRITDPLLVYGQVFYGQAKVDGSIEQPSGRSSFNTQGIFKGLAQGVSYDFSESHLNLRAEHSVTKTSWYYTPGLLSYNLGLMIGWYLN